MRIGIDFDNTIADYTGVFHRVAVAEGLIPDTTPTDKASVRDYLRKIGQEDEWTVLQGKVYGQDLDQVPPFPGAVEFIRDGNSAGHDIFIVSHKTKRPYMGPPYDLHLAALNFLQANQVFERDGCSLPTANVFLEITKQKKLERIESLDCDIFVDDLPEFLLEDLFPQNVEKILFDPSDRHGRLSDTLKIRHSWADISKELL